MNATVRALAVLGNGDLVAGGSFTEAGEGEVSYIARWDTNQWHPLGDAFNGPVTALLTLDSGDLVAAGPFTMAGKIAVNRIGLWDGEHWHPMGEGFDNGLVNAMIQMPTGDIIAAGTFTSSGGQAVNRIARWDGTQWHAMNGGMDAAVHSLAVFDSGSGPMLYAAGDFVTAGEIQVNHIARWDADAAQWQPLMEGVDGPVKAMTVFDDGSGPSLYLTGHFSTAGNVPVADTAARFDGELWWPFSGGMDGIIQHLAVLNDGEKQSLYGVQRIIVDNQASDWLVKWEDMWFKRISEMDPATHAFCSDGSTLLIGGGFTSVNGQPANNIVSWQPCPPPEPIVRHVPGQYATIQSAIDAADDGDLVLVAPGEYHETIDFLGKTIVVEGEQGAEKTIIRGAGLEQQYVVRASNGERQGTTLRGFTVYSGSPVNPGQYLYACVLVWQASLTVDQCVLTREPDHHNLGMSVGPDADALILSTIFADHFSESDWSVSSVFITRNRSARFYDCVFTDNTFRGSAGFFIHFLQPLGNAMFQRCTFTDNLSQPSGYLSTGGGAGESHGDVFLHDCDFIGNQATSSNVGGALNLFGVSTIRQCRFQGNSARYGGAIHTFGRIHIENCAFNDNAALNGGAVMIGSTNNPSTLADSAFCDNLPNHLAGLSDIQDLGGNTFADSCETTPGDLNGDGSVDVTDLLMLLAAIGDCPQDQSCPADLTGDGIVDTSDLLLLLAAWS